MKHWKIKLTLIVGAIYLIASLPFFLGACEPSIHEGLYPMLFTALNLPALLVISSPVSWLEKMAFPEATLHTSNLIGLAAALICWLALAFAIGCLIDWRRHKICSADKRPASKAA